MHFRARWRVNHDLVASNQAVQDMPYLIANGKGVYVGTTVMLLNPNPIPVARRQLVGRRRRENLCRRGYPPVHLRHRLGRLFQLRLVFSRYFRISLFPANPATTVPAIVDLSPIIVGIFSILYHFNLELRFIWNSSATSALTGVSYARIAYHYALPGLMDDHLPITDEDIRHLELPDVWIPAARRGAANSVFFQAEELAQGQSNLTFDENNIWSLGRAMIWHPETIGETLTLALPVEEEGTYTIRFGSVRNENAGTFSMRLNGESLDFDNGESVVNLYVPLSDAESDRILEGCSVRKGRAGVKHPLRRRTTDRRWRHDRDRFCLVAETIGEQGSIPLPRN